MFKACYLHRNAKDITKIAKKIRVFCYMHSVRLFPWKTQEL